MLRLILLTCCLAVATVVNAAVSVADTRCEYRVNPIGVDTSQPRLSWVLESKNRGVLQSAYQVLVASSAELLKKNQGDLWDSGKVASGESIQVAYGGKTLAAGQVCFWKVRVWDQADQAAKWSPPATWTMGLLQPGDWQAQWIGFPATVAQSKFDRLLALDGCAWVWANGTVAGNQPRGKVYFRKQLELPAHTPVTRAKFVLTADDNLQLHVNGQPAGGAHRNWKQLATRDVASLLRPGANLFAIEAENTGENPAGLAGRLVIEFVNGDTLFVPIDSSWRSSRVAGADWKEVREAGADWQPAAEIVRYGEQPWGTLARQAISPAPFFRKAFTVTKPIKRATAFAAALGVYELHLNGKPVDTDVLSPGWTDFGKRAHYRGYDVTEQLKRGDNVLGAMLGDGWYASYLAFTGKRHYYGGEPRLRVQLQIEYQDGTREVIGTDGTWQAAVGPILEADLLMGCAYDARAEFAGWDKSGFDAAKWQPAQVDGAVLANLVAHPGEPMRRTEEVTAKKITEPRPGVYVFDLGQNMVGWARLKVKGKAGQKVTVRHAEMLNPDGTIYVTNLRAALATDSYILADAGPRTFEPYFTFHGFQYVEVTGLDYQPALADVVGVVVHSDLSRAGWFECSEPLVNKLTLNSLWGQRGNFLDVPTDCPQRDERAGWTGDTQFFIPTAAYNFNVAPFFTRWLTTICEDSQAGDGSVAHVAPDLGLGSGGTAWGDAAIICTYNIYKTYGDTRVIAAHFPAMERLLAWYGSKSTGLIPKTHVFGDWLNMGGGASEEVLNTAYYAYLAGLMSEMARAIGNDAPAARYEKLHGEIKAVFAGFFEADGSLRNCSQTGYALAFSMELVPDALREKAAAKFAGEIERFKDHIATGFIGTPRLLPALHKAGRDDLAYRLLLQETYPSWLFQVKLGATTMWERWDGWTPDKGFQTIGMNSFNHYAFGAVGQYLYENVAGIAAESPAYKKISIRPVIGEGLTWAKASYDSMYGKIVSNWKLEGKALTMDVTIPANTTATVHVPGKDGGVREVASGQHQFKSTLP